MHSGNTTYFKILADMIKYLCICLFNGWGLHYQEKQNNVTHLVLDFHSKNMLVVAEGVEEKEEFDYLVGLGVDLFQGYYLARPA